MSFYIISLFENRFIVRTRIPNCSDDAFIKIKLIPETDTMKRMTVNETIETNNNTLTENDQISITFAAHTRSYLYHLYYT